MVVSSAKTTSYILDLEDVPQTFPEAIVSPAPPSTTSAPDHETKLGDNKLIPLSVSLDPVTEGK